jgi:hypothetical protein
MVCRAVSQCDAQPLICGCMQSESESIHQDIKRLVASQTELIANLSHPELGLALQGIHQAAARLSLPDSGLDGPNAQVAVLAESAASQLQKTLEEKAVLFSLEHYSRRLRPRKV